MVLQAFEGLIVPFDLHIRDIPLVHGFLLRNPSSIQAAAPPISLGTQESYTPVVKTFQTFCESCKYSFADFREKHVLFKNSTKFVNNKKL